MGRKRTAEPVELTDSPHEALLKVGPQITEILRATAAAVGSLPAESEIGVWFLQFSKALLAEYKQEYHEMLKDYFGPTQEGTPIDDVIYHFYKRVFKVVRGAIERDKTAQQLSEIRPAILKDTLIQDALLEYAREILHTANLPAETSEERIQFLDSLPNEVWAETGELIDTNAQIEVEQLFLEEILDFAHPLSIEMLEFISCSKNQPNPASATRKFCTIFLPRAGLRRKRGERSSKIRPVEKWEIVVKLPPK